MEYTVEQLNFFRICYIVFDLIPKSLRSVFKSEWDIRYKGSFGEWKDTTQNGSDFFNSESKKSRSRNARLLTTIKNGNTAEWDCSCLFFAILFSDSIGTTLSRLVRTNVNDLREFRNYIAHITEAKFTDAGFHNSIGRVLVDFSSMGLPISDIEEVKNQTSFPTSEVNRLMALLNNLQEELKRAKSNFHASEEQVRKLTFDLQQAEDTILREQEQIQCLSDEINSRVVSFCHLPFKPSHQIVKRTNDVSRILTQMQKLEDGCKGVVSTIYLSGSPGCGKSQIARQIGQEFFRTSSDESNGQTFVATVNAETLETLVDSYITLAKQLGVTEYTLTQLATSKDSSPKETIHHLKSLIFPKMRQFFKWLIIADNVEDLSMVLGYLPQTASEECGHGQILITTQDTSAIPTSAPQTYHESLSVGMQREDALELLKQVSQISNHKRAEEVVEVLEFQPLALAAAAFYVCAVVRHGSPNYTWHDYLETFSRGEREGTEEPLAKENGAYSKTMTTAVKMALNNASKNDEILRQTFYLLSLCASESLPIEAAVSFVKARTATSTKETDERPTKELIKAKILKSSLITCLRGDDKVPEYFKMHQIVHEVLKATRITHPETRKALPDAIRSLHQVLLSEYDQLFTNGHACVKLRRVTSHCKALHDVLSTMLANRGDLVKTLASSNTPASIAAWLSTTATVCCDLSNPSDAILFSTSACAFIEYMSNTKETEKLKADILAVHGRVLTLQCQYELSLLFLEESTNISIAVYGKEHATVAGCYNNLGNVSRKLGDYSEAKVYYKKALNITKKIYGEEHPNVATSYNNMGVVYSDLRRHHEAKEYYEKAVIIAQKIYGEEHADTARTYNNLGNVHNDLQQYDRAIAYHKKALKIRKKIYGEEHADVAGSYNNLGNVYRNLGEYVQAKQCHVMALKIQQKVYGEGHMKVATSYHNLNIIYRDSSLQSRVKSNICSLL